MKITVIENGKAGEIEVVEHGQPYVIGDVITLPKPNPPRLRLLTPLWVEAARDAQRYREARSERRFWRIVVVVIVVVAGFLIYSL